MTKRELMALAKRMVKFDAYGPAPDDGMHLCYRCRDHYHLSVGLDASALCHTCAQETAQDFARLLTS